MNTEFYTEIHINLSDKSVNLNELQLKNELLKEPSVYISVMLKSNSKALNFCIHARNIFIIKSISIFLSNSVLERQASRVNHKTICH